MIPEASRHLVMIALMAEALVSDDLSPFNLSELTHEIRLLVEKFLLPPSLFRLLLVPTVLLLQF